MVEWGTRTPSDHSPLATSCACIAPNHSATESGVLGITPLLGVKADVAASVYRGILFYLLAYTVTTLGAFGILAAPDGTVLGLRELLHPHETEQPFTRSLSGVVIPEGLTTVLVTTRCLADGWTGAALEVALPGR